MTAPEARPRTTRRRIAVAAVSVAALLIAAFAWSLTSLRGLPDIGDPFDVAAFSSPAVRDEDNAFVLYRQAGSLYRPWQGAATYEWPKADAEERRWLEENRPALQVWKRGTERPDALLISPSVVTFDLNTDALTQLRDLARLACLEGSRLEAEGDLVGAWTWYRAVLRASRHCGHRGILIERIIGVALHRHASNRITAWSRRPDVDAKAIREALADVQAIDAMTAPMSDAVKCEYLSFCRSTAQPELLWKWLLFAAQPPGSPSDRSAALKTALLRAGAFLKREPERSRRVFQLVAANWLAYCDLPPGERPPLDPTHKLVYLADPSAPPSARLLAPDQMNVWYESTILLHLFYPALDASRNAIDRERATQAALVVHLASELYRREHGEPPDSPEVPVGPHLKAPPTGVAKPAGESPHPREKRP